MPNSISDQIVVQQKLVNDLTINYNNAVKRANAYQDDLNTALAHKPPQQGGLGYYVYLAALNKWQQHVDDLKRMVDSIKSEADTFKSQLTQAKADLATMLLNADKLNEINLTPDQRIALQAEQANATSVLLKAASYAQNHKVIVISITLVVLVLLSIIIVKKFIL